MDLGSDLNLSGTTHTNAGTYASDAWTFHDATGNYNRTPSGTVRDSIARANAAITVTPYSVTYDGNATRPPARPRAWAAWTWAAT